MLKICRNVTSRTLIAGGLWDAVFSFILGIVVGILDMIASTSAMFATIIEFASAFWISFLAKCILWRFKYLRLCYISLTLGSLTQLLPGISTDNHLLFSCTFRLPAALYLQIFMRVFHNSRN